MNTQDLLDAGGDILNAVTDAVAKNDYSGLNAEIMDRVGRAARNISPRTEAQQNSENWQQRYDAQHSRPGGRENAGAQGEAGVRSGMQRGRSTEKSSVYTGMQTPAQPHSWFLQQQPSRSRGLGMFFLGLSGMIINAPLTILMLLVLIGVAFMDISSGVLGVAIAAVIFGGLFGGSLYLFNKGNRERHLVAHYYRYAQLLGEREFFNIREFATQLGMEEKALRAELWQMIKRGFLPRVHLDRGETTLILTESAYEQYRVAEAARAERERQAARDKEQQAQQEAGLSGDASDILRRGRQYIRSVQAANDAIPDDQEMSTKLYRLENIMDRIFAQLQKTPAAAGDLRRLMDYYLPTTDKLLRAYVDLDRQPEVDNVVRARGEIENAMDSICDAFEKLLDDMFQDMAWDISSDISVMKTMMAQDGLTTGDRKEESKPVPVYEPAAAYEPAETVPVGENNGNEPGDGRA